MSNQNSLFVLGISRGGLKGNNLTLNIYFKHDWVSLTGYKNITPPEGTEQGKELSLVKFCGFVKRNFYSVKLELCVGETVIANLLSKDVICALAEWGSAIIQKGKEIYFRKLQHVEFKENHWYLF